MSNKKKYGVLEVAVSFVTLQEEGIDELHEDEFILRVERNLSSALGRDIADILVSPGPWDEIRLWNARGCPITPPQRVVTAVAKAQRKAARSVQRDGSSRR